MEQNKYSLPQFAATIREKTGKGKDMTDEILVREWVKEYPGDRPFLDSMGEGYIQAIELAESTRPKQTPIDPNAPPKPLVQNDQASREIGSTKLSLAKNLLFDPILPDVSKLPVWARPINVGPSAGVLNPALQYNALRQVSSPVDVASLGSLGATSLATKIGAKGIARVAPLLDRAASASVMGVGATDVIDAVTNSNTSPQDRLLQGGTGAMMAGLGALGLRAPQVPSPLPANASPLPKPQPLALPPVGGTTPTTTRFYAGPAGIADVTQQYQVHTTRPANPLLGNPDTAATPTSGEIGQMRTLPTIEAARGPSLSGLHGTGSPLPVTQEMIDADMARQVKTAFETAAAKARETNRALPPATNPSVTPPSSTVQTGTGGNVDFPYTDRIKTPMPEVLPAPKVEQYSVEGRIFTDPDEAIDYALSKGRTEIMVVSPDGKIEHVPILGPGEEGFAKSALLRPLAGGLAGGAAGATQGDTTQERVLGGLAGAVGGAALGTRAAGRLAQKGLSKMGDAAYKPTQLNIPPVEKPPLRAFHGTPHKFDKFDMSKIGSGEGAQAYGRGLYFAEDPATARTYRDQLSGSKVYVGNRELEETSPVTGLAARYIRANGGNVDYAISDLSFAVKSTEDPRTRRVYEETQKYLEAVRGQIQVKRGGAVLETQIKANPNHLIDWDKPFDQQPEYVRKQLAKILDIDSASLRAWSGRDIYQALAGRESMALAPRKLEGKISTERDIVELLRKNGIKGIKYLDGNSRRAGKGTSNFVIFDDKLIDIVGREEGFIENILMRRGASGAAGALAGGAVGETPEEKLKLAVVGGLVGAALPRGAARMPRRVPAVSTQAQDLLMAQAKEGKKGQDSAINLGIGTRLKRNLVTRFAPNDALDDVVEKNIGRKLGAEERSGDTNRRVLGGQSGRIRAALLDLEDVVRNTKDIDEEVRSYLNMKGILHAHSTLLKKAGKMGPKEREALLKRMEEGKVFPQKFTRKDAEEALRLAEASPNAPRVKEAADKIFKFNRETLDMLHKDGIISTEGYEELVSRGEEYVPLFRRSEGGLIDGAANDIAANLEREMVDRGRSAGLTLKQMNTIKALHGSERVTQDPYQASLYLRQLAERELGRNEAARTLFKLRDVDPDGAGKLIIPLDTVKNGKVLGKKNPPPGYAEVTFRQEGKVVSYAVPLEIAQAQLLVDGKALVAGMSALGSFLQGGKGILQATATGLNLPFSLFNIQRDFRTARRFLSANKSTPVSMAKSLSAWRKALVSRLKKDESFREALRSRALHGTLQETITPTPLVVGGPKVGPIKKVVNSVAELSKIMEETTKLMAYNQMKKAAPLAEAVKETRRFGGSPDFADMGTKISEGWNLAFMFLNPSIQGIAQNVRGIGRRPGKALGQLGAAVGASIALFKWNSQFRDENGKPEIEHVPKYDRDTAFIVILPMKDEKTGRHFYLSVLKKAHADRLFYNATQDAIQMAAGDTNISKAQIGLDAASQFLPGSVGLEAKNLAGTAGRSVLASANPAVRIPVESFGNFKSFEGVPIESQRLRSLPPELRYDSTTGKTYRRLGELSGVSPKKIQHGVEGLFNAPGRAVVGAIDSLQKPTSINVDTMDAVKKLPLVGQLAGAVVRGGGDEKLSKGIDNLYKMAEKAKQQKAALRDSRTRRPSTSGKIETNLVNLATPLDTLTRELSKIRAVRESIIAGEKKVTNAAEVLRRLRAQEIKLVARGEQLTKGLD